MMFRRTQLFDSESAATTLSLNMADLRAELAAMYRALAAQSAKLAGQQRQQLQQQQQLLQADGKEMQTDNKEGMPAGVVYPRTSADILALEHDGELLVSPELVEMAAGDLAFLAGEQQARALLVVFLPYALEYRQALVALVGTDRAAAQANGPSLLVNTIGVVLEVVATFMHE